MKTRKWGSLYPRTEHLSGKFAAFLATMLLLLAPASAMADDATDDNDNYIVKLSADGTTVTFTADDGTTVDNTTCWTLDEWSATNLSDKSKVTKVTFDESFSTARPTSTRYWFNKMNNLANIEGLNNLNTSEVTDMACMFSECKNLKTLDLGENFKTDNVTNMFHMFYYCSGLTELNLSSFNTANVTSMESMFDYCSGLTELNLSSFNTANVKNMESMFQNCTNLKGIIFGENFNTSSVNTSGMRNMFYYCSALTELDLSNFNTANINSTSYMFQNCTNLKSIIFGEKFNIAKVEDMYCMFANCKNLTKIDLSKFNTARVENMGCMFSGCISLQKITFGEKFSTAKVTSMTSMFNSCEKLESIDLSKFNTANVKTMSGMFSNCQTLESINLSKFNTANVTLMSSMFRNCISLTELDLSSFNTAKVTDMHEMFEYCENLKTIIFGENFNTSIVTHMNLMFGNCEALTELDLSKFNFESIKFTGGMFEECANLANINIGNNNSLKNQTTSPFKEIENCKMTVGAGFDASVLGTPDDKGIYSFYGGKFTLQLALNEDNADDFVAATESGTDYNTVVLKRTFNDNAWNTLVVPFDISDEDAKEAFGDNVQIAKYTGATTNENTDVNGFEYILNFETSTDGIKANEPVFIYGVKTTSDNCYTFTGENTINVIKDTPTKSDNNINFVGTYATGYVPQGNYFIASDNKIYRAANAQTNTIKATRATFAPVSANNEAKIASFVIGGETTGISLPTTVNRVADGAAYNLQGQRVGPNYNGMVIQQGKKYLRK